MKFTAHAKTFKPEEPPSAQTKPLITGHAHVHTPPHLLEKVVPVFDETVYAKYGASSWATVSEDDVSLDAVDGGPVLIGVDHAAVKPASISITQALDALSHHGVLFENVSMDISVHGTKLQARMSIVGDDAKGAVMALHNWLYKPSKGY